MFFKSIVFEDDLFVSTAMSRSLQGEGFLVQEVNTTLSKSLDVTVDDAQLIIIGTKEDFGSLTRLQPSCGIVVLKEAYRKEEILDLFALGVDLYMEKPFDIDMSPP